MTDRSVPFDRQNAPVRPDFDLVEDLGTPAPNDAEVFNRALSALLPGEGRDPAEDSAGVDIDLDDFEAFNRELDARLAEARMCPVDDEPTVDLGSDVIPAFAPAPTPATSPPTVEVEVAEDVVTLGTAPVSGVGVRAPAEATVLGAPETVAAGSAAAEPAPVAARSGSGLALAIGGIGLLAGAAGLWINHSHQAYLAHLESVVAKATSAAAQPATPAPNPELLALDKRIREIARRLEALDTAVGDASESNIHSPDDLEERLTRAEAQLAAAKAAERTAPIAAEQQKSQPVVSPPTETKQAAGEPARATEAAVPTTPTAPTKPLATATGSSTAPPLGSDSEPMAKAAKTTAESVTPKTADPAVAPPAPARAAPIAEATAASAATPTAPAKAKKPPPKPAGGAWTVVVESFPTEAAAYKRLNRIEGTGLIGDVLPVQINGETWHRVVVPGYGSQDDAKAAAADLRGRNLGRQPWVFQRSGD